MTADLRGRLRVVVDMSATLIHHGHIRLLKQASELGYVIVALTTDEGVRAHKGYEPELPYEARAEILRAIRYVDEVIPCDWLIDEAFLDRHRAHLLIHGSDNTNPVPADRLRILPRTSGISSSLLRQRVLEAVKQLSGDTVNEE